MKANFNDIINSDTPVLVDFHATWCGPCIAMAPVLQDLANEVGENARIIKIDVDKNPHIANQYQVRGVPTFIVFRNGKVEWQQAGMVPKQVLKEKLQN